MRVDHVREVVWLGQDEAAGDTAVVSYLASSCYGLHEGQVEVACVWVVRNDGDH